MSRFCIKCGAANEERAEFCASCGQPMPQMNQQYEQGASMNQQHREPMGQQFQQTTDQNANDDDCAQPKLGMKWYNFQVNANLWFCMILYFIMGILYVTGMIYSIMHSSAESVYEYYPSLQLVNILEGISMFALAVFSFFLRKNLVEYKKNAPTMFYLFIIVPPIIDMCYNLFSLVILESDTSEIPVMIFRTVISTGVVFYLNYIYFTKRKHLFKN